MILLRKNLLMKKILLYGLSEKENHTARDMAQSAGVPAYVIGDEVLDEKVGDVLKIQEDLNPIHEQIEEEFLLADGFQVSDFLGLLKNERTAQALQNVIKVIVSEENLDWTVRALFSRAGQQAVINRKAAVLQGMIQACNGLDVSGMDAQAQMLLKERLRKSVLLLRSGNYDADKLDQAAKELNESLKGSRRLYS